MLISSTCHRHWWRGIWIWRRSLGLLSWFPISVSQVSATYLKIRRRFHLCARSSNVLGILNPLWPSDAIWRQWLRSGSTMAQVMACGPSNAGRLGARHQAITWTNVDWSSVKSSDIHVRAISQQMPQPSIIICIIKSEASILFENYISKISFKFLVTPPFKCFCPPGPKIARRVAPAMAVGRLGARPSATSTMT